MRFDPLIGLRRGVDVGRIGPAEAPAGSLGTDSSRSRVLFIRPRA